MNKKQRIFMIFLLAILVLSFMHFLAPLDPLATQLDELKESPSWAHLCGTDEIGRDIFSRALLGCRYTFLVGFLSTIAASILGGTVGLLAGYFGRWVDQVLSLFTNIALSFPSLLLAIAFSVVLPSSLFSVIICLVLVGWADFSKLIRAQVLTLKKEEYISSAKALGSSHIKICFTHILPNCLHLFIVSASLKLGMFMLAESGLSFLGLGIPAPHPSLGGMISEGRSYLFSHPWIPLFPGLFITFMVLFFNWIGGMLQRIYNPKQNG